MITINISTQQRTELLPITGPVAEAVSESGVENGICVVYCPHTAAAITVNENADPDVARDLARAADRLVPLDDPNYRHAKGIRQHT